MSLHFGMMISRSGQIYLCNKKWELLILGVTWTYVVIEAEVVHIITKKFSWKKFEIKALTTDVKRQEDEKELEEPDRGRK